MRYKRLAILLAPLALLGSGIAYASIPSSSDAVFHACVQNTAPMGQRMVKIIDADAGDHCQNGYTEKTWSQTGPQGPVGATGPQGPAGSDAAVPEHVLHTSYLLDEREVISANSNAGDDGTHYTFYCNPSPTDPSPPGGHDALLGAMAWVQVGGSVPGSVDAGAVYNSANGDGLHPTGVQVIAWNHTNSEGELRVTLTCAHEVGYAGG